MRPDIEARELFAALISQVEAISDYACEPAIGSEDLHKLRDLSLALNNAAARTEHRIFVSRFWRATTCEISGNWPPRRNPPPGQI